MSRPIAPPAPAASLASTATAAAATSLVLLLTGCSGSDGAGSASRGGERATERDDSPLDGFFEALNSLEEDYSDAALLARTEEVVAACMREEGFDYTPREVPDPADAEPDPHLPAFDTVEYAQAYGYGLIERGDEEDASEEPEDPNADDVASMSKAERRAWDEALNGDRAQVAMADPDAEYDWTTSGCAGRAQHEVYEVESPFGDVRYTALHEDFLRLDVTGDPRLGALNSAWSDCMADAGFPGLDDPGHALQSVIDAQSAARMEAGPSGPDAEALAQMRERERDTAVADRTCHDEVDYAEGEADVRRELEQAFVDAHQDELDALLEAYAEDAP